MSSARVDQLPVFNSADFLSRSVQMTTASPIASAGSPELQQSPGDPMDISPTPATATTIGTQHGVSATSAGISQPDVFIPRFTTANQPDMFPTNHPLLSRNGVLTAQPATMQHGHLAAQRSRIMGPSTLASSSFSSSSATTIPAGRSSALVGLRGSLNTLNTLGTRHAFTSFGPRSIGPTAPATAAASSSVTGRPVSRPTGLLSHFLTGSTTLQNNGHAGASRLASSNRSSRNMNHSFSVRGPSTALRPATNNLLNARAGSHHFRYEPYRRPVHSPRLLGQPSGQVHSSTLHTPQPKPEVRQDTIDADRVKLFASPPSKTSRKRSIHEADAEAIWGREGAMGVTPLTATSRQLMPGSWPESPVHDASDQQVKTPAQSWILISVCRTIKKFFRRTGLVADTVRFTARYATATANSMKRRAVEFFTTHTHIRRRPSRTQPVASQQRRASEARYQSRRAEDWILESERTTNVDAAVPDTLVPTLSEVSRGPVLPPSPLAATRTFDEERSKEKRIIMSEKVKKQLDEKKKVRKKHRLRVKRARHKQLFETAAPNEETRMFSELAPYLTPLIPLVQHVDAYKDAVAVEALTQAEIADHETLEPHKMEPIEIEQPDLAEIAVEDVGDIDAATQLQTELTTQAAAIEADRRRRDDDSLGRLLRSEHPFGRPVSAVRLFGPEPDVLPEGRTASIYADEWREIEAARRIEEQTPSRIKPQGPAVRPLPAQWEERVERMKEMPNSKQIATTLSGDPLTKHTFATCYTPLAWLNDEIINAYLALLTSYLRESTGNAGRHDKPRFHAFNSFFFSNLRDKGYESVRRWATRAKIGGKDLLDVDTVFIPVHHASHWTLIVVKPTARTIEHFDSLGSLSARHVGVVQEWLRMELGSNYVPSEWRVLPSCSPQQDNGSDCGVFLLSTAKAVALDIDPMSYGANDTPLLRRKICAELLNGGLDGDFVPNGTL